MPTIDLVRHGRPAASWGDAESDPGLDEIGRRQAESLADTLLSSGRPPPSVVISSPLRRCRETAAPTAATLGLAIEIEPAVSEIPTPARLRADERPAWLRRAMAGRWRDIVGDLDYEAWRAAVVAAVARQPGAAIFTHFVALNAVASALQGTDSVIVFRPDHASITSLECIDGSLAIRSLGGEAATLVT